MAQRTLFAGPSPEAPEELYALAEKGVMVRERDRVILDGHALVTTNTFFGRFPASYWQRWTSVGSVDVSAAVSGSGLLRVMASDSRGRRAHGGQPPGRGRPLRGRPPDRSPRQVRRRRGDVAGAADGDRRHDRRAGPVVGGRGDPVPPADRGHHLHVQPCRRLPGDARHPGLRSRGPQPSSAPCTSSTRAATRWSPATDFPALRDRLGVHAALHPPAEPRRGRGIHARYLRGRPQRDSRSGEPAADGRRHPARARHRSPATCPGRPRGPSRSSSAARCSTCCTPSGLHVGRRDRRSRHPPRRSPRGGRAGRHRRHRGAPGDPGRRRVQRVVDLPDPLRGGRGHRLSAAAVLPVGRHRVRPPGAGGGIPHGDAARGRRVARRFLVEELGRLVALLQLPQLADHQCAAQRVRPAPDRRTTWPGSWPTTWSPCATGWRR